VKLGDIHIVEVAIEKEQLSLDGVVIRRVLGRITHLYQNLLDRNDSRQTCVRLEIT
jgi:hypothetical protein